MNQLHSVHTIFRVEIVKHKIVSSKDKTLRVSEIENYFTELVEAGEEGLVLKGLSSSYILGEKSRQLQLWVKLKPDYGGLTTDLDVLVLGSYLGEGKYGKGRSFLCGVRDPEKPGKYATVGKVGSGCSGEKLTEIDKVLVPHRIPWSGRTFLPSHFLPWIYDKKDMPDHWYPPENSIVLQLKCNELIQTRKYSAKICWRFPRLQRVRLDKSYAEVMTIADINEIFMAPHQNLSSDAMINDLLVTSSSSAVDRAPTKQRAKRGSTTDLSQNDEKDRRLSGITPSHLSVITSLAQPALDHIFDGMSFCVFESDFSCPSGYYSRTDIQKLIQSHGGKVLANVPCTMCIVGNMLGSGYSVTIRNNMATGLYDFVHFSYLLKCVEAGVLLDVETSLYVKLSDGCKHILYIYNQFLYNYI